MVSHVHVHIPNPLSAVAGVCLHPKVWEQPAFSIA